MIDILNHEIKHHTDKFNELVKQSYGDWAMIELPILLDMDSTQSFFERLLIIVEAVDVCKLERLNDEIREKYESISIQYINKLYTLLNRYLK
jgi:hypothetical protein